MIPLGYHVAYRLVISMDAMKSFQRKEFMPSEMLPLVPSEEILRGISGMFEGIRENFSDAQSLEVFTKAYMHFFFCFCLCVFQLKLNLQSSTVRIHVYILGENCHAFSLRCLDYSLIKKRLMLQCLSKILPRKVFAN